MAACELCGVVGRLQGVRHRAVKPPGGALPAPYARALRVAVCRKDRKALRHHDAVTTLTFHSLVAGQLAKSLHLVMATTDPEEAIAVLSARARAAG